MTPEIRVLDDAAGVSHAGAEEFATLARAAVTARGRFVVALSGGATPRRLYRALAEEPLRARVAWDRVEFFWGDERAVPPDRPESNYRMAATALLDRLPVEPARIHRIRAEALDRGEAAREYQAEIARVLAADPAGPPPRFDLVLLGMGADGHTASLFPGSAALRERRRWVVSHFVPAVGADRITLTVPVINRAREIRILVAGPDKTARLREVLQGPDDPERLPVQLVQPEAGRLVWLVDRAAAGALDMVGSVR